MAFYSRSDLDLRTPKFDDSTSGDKKEEEIDIGSIYVGNVDYGATEEELKQHFHSCGSIEKVTFIHDKTTGQRKGCAYIKFASPDSVDKAKLLDKSCFREREIKVEQKLFTKPENRGTHRSTRGRGRGARASEIPSSHRGQDREPPKTNFAGNPLRIQYIIEYMSSELIEIEQTTAAKISCEENVIRLSGTYEQIERAKQKLQVLHDEKIIIDQHQVDMHFHSRLLQDRPQILVDVGKFCKTLIIIDTEDKQRTPAPDSIKAPKNLAPPIHLTPKIKRSVRKAERDEVYDFDGPAMRTSQELKLSGINPSSADYMTEKEKKGIQPSMNDAQKLSRNYLVIGRCTFRVIKGLLQQSTKQAIVHSAGPDINLQATALGKAISEAAGPELQRECAKLARTPLNEGEVRDSKPYKLKCVRILHCRLHANGRDNQANKDLTELIIKCLEFVGLKLKYQSVAFPALGTGALNYPADMVAECFIDGLKYYTSKYVENCLSEVEVVIHPDQLTIYKAFLDTVERSASQNLNQITPTVAHEDRPKSQITRQEQSRSPCQNRNVLQLTIYGLKEDNIRETKERLADKLREQTTVIHFGSSEHESRKIASLSRELVSHMYEKANRMGVELAISSNTIKIAGDQTAVDGYQHFIEAEFLKIDKSLSERKLKEFHLSNIKWVYRKGTEEEWTDFNWEDSHHLESTYKRNTSEKHTFSSMEFKASLTVDLNKNSFIFHGNSYMISRIDKQLVFPNHWDLCAGDLEVVPVKKGSTQYKNVEANFMDTINNPKAKVKEICRVQHFALYKQYIAQRSSVANKLGKAEDQVERVPLWHGAPEDVVYKIAKSCFDRSYSGMSNANLYGAGSYFARDASYSARDEFSKPDDVTREKCMIQARVIVGEYTLGKQDMKVLPFKSHGIRYDSSVDSVQDPAIFVVFHDAAAYPEYIVKFTM